MGNLATLCDSVRIIKWVRRAGLLATYRSLSRALIQWGRFLVLTAMLVYLADPFFLRGMFSFSDEHLSSRVIVEVLFVSTGGLD